MFGAPAPPNGGLIFGPPAGGLMLGPPPPPGGIITGPPPPPSSLEGGDGLEIVGGAGGGFGIRMGVARLFMR